MNATVKSVIDHHSLSWRLPSLPLQYLKQYMIVGTLMLLVFFSSLAVVYVQSLNRQLVSERQQLLQQQHQEHNRWAELMAARGSLDDQRQFALLAQKELHMKLPTSNNVVMVHF